MVGEARARLDISAEHKTRRDPSGATRQKSEAKTSKVILDEGGGEKEARERSGEAIMLSSL